MILLRADLPDAIKRLFEDFFPLFVVLIVLVISTVKRILDVLRRGRHPEPGRPTWKEEVRRYLETLEGRRTEAERRPVPAPPPRPRAQAAGRRPLTVTPPAEEVPARSLWEPEPPGPPLPPRRRWLQPGEARRAIVLREVLGSPLAFRPLSDPMDR